MADAFIPVVINATAFISAQYKQVLSGIKTAAAKMGRTIRVFTEELVGKFYTEYGSLQCEAAVTKEIVPFEKRLSVRFLLVPLPSQTKLWHTEKAQAAIRKF